MIPILVTLNLMIAVFLCGVAVWVWALRRRLARTADWLTQAERACHRVLHQAPAGMLEKQVRAKQWRDRYGLLQYQVQQAQQALALVSVGLSLWRGGWRRRSPRSRLPGSR
ncbi:MAG: hypothetical protein KME20_02165 [Kaiparowitsia implicata GSE-PSE-MK54-09C]|jgi:adenosyl cobinamide kinase/adenosyl cobinamide phosphate guanylyltransferase|nr:hypothetical protein [Kaiparowitsia implicata GSE-PSE-MK54-09C]